MLISSYCTIVLLLILPRTYQDASTTDEIDLRNENYSIIRYAAILIFTIFLLHGIICNMLMTIALFCSREKKHYAYPFLLIASQLIISNFSGFLPYTVVVLPEMLLSKNNLYGLFFFYLFTL